MLTALGYPDEEARGSLRISLGRTTTDEEIDSAVAIVPQAISALRASTALNASDALGEQVGA